MLEANPILKREVRARWRGGAFWLLLGYAVALSLYMVSAYGFAVHAATLSHYAVARPALAQVGYLLFRSLNGVQTIAWMVLAPVLTATSLVTERERGLLELLRLSRLTPWRIVTGKLGSALTLLGLLLLVPLPVTAICFIFGGLAPGDFALAALLQAATATTGAVIGLYASARSRRSAAALRLAALLIAAWGGSGLLLDWLGWGKFVPGQSWSAACARGWWQANPVIAIGSINLPIGHAIFKGTPLQFLDSYEWATCLLFETLLCALLLPMTARAVRRPLPEAAWFERRRFLAWRHGRLALVAYQETDGRQPAAAKTGATGAAGPVWDVPLASLVCFANPVLQHEVRGKLRLRRFPPLVMALGGLLALALVVGYVVAFYWAWAWAWFFPASRYATWTPLWETVLGLTIVVAAVLGACGFAREHEAGTWEALRLSRLTAGELLRAKLLSTLIVIGAALLWCLPLVPPFLTLEPRQVPGITPLQAVATLSLVVAAAWCYTALGLLFSTACRRTATAVAVTLGGVFVILVVIPDLMQRLIEYGASLYWGYLNVNDMTISDDEARRILTDFGVRLWHPWMALQAMAPTRDTLYINVYGYNYDYKSTLYSPGQGLLTAVVLFATGAGLLLLTQRRLERALRPDRDRKPPAPRRWGGRARNVLH